MAHSQLKSCLIPITKTLRSNNNNLSLALKIPGQIRGCCRWFNFEFACKKQLGFYKSILRKNNNNKIGVRDENHQVHQLNDDIFPFYFSIFFSFILRQNAINEKLWY